MISSSMYDCNRVSKEVLTVTQQRMAIKETMGINAHEWCSPFNWRDQLPMPIAIQERRRNEGGHPNIHGHRGYWLNMREKRYRVYNDVCKYGDMLKG